MLEENNLAYFVKKEGDSLNALKTFLSLTLTPNKLDRLSLVWLILMGEKHPALLGNIRLVWTKKKVLLGCHLVSVNVRGCHVRSAEGAGYHFQVGNFWKKLKKTLIMSASV